MCFLLLYLYYRLTNDRTCPVCERVFGLQTPREHNVSERDTFMSALILNGQHIV